MRYLILIPTTLFFLFSTSLWASDSSYNNYYGIVSDLNNQLKTKKTPQSQILLNSSYSLSAGLNTQLHKIKKTNVTSFGVGAELGIYYLTFLPIKLGTSYSSGDDTSEVNARLKTDYSVYKHNLIDVKIGLAAGMAFFRNDNFNFTSLYLSPSTSIYYQIDKRFDISFNIEYLFHNSSEVSNHFNPSVNLVTYF